MFELSHRLIGIYKTANATRSTSVHVVSVSCSLTPVSRAGISIDNHALSNIPVNAVPVAS